MFNELKKVLDEIVTEYNTPGVDCIVYREHEQIFRYYTGMSDLENAVEVNGNELYLIFSMTKMLTCTCALQLFEEGKFRMDDPLSQYMNEFQNMKIAGGGYATKPITIKDLFTMSGGFDYTLEAKGIQEAIAEGKTSTREIVSAMSDTVLGFEPGTGYRYSFCHDILGALIEIWSGMKLGDYMEEYLFKPLGMKDTFLGIPKDEQKLAKMSKRYDFDENRRPMLLKLTCPYILSDEYESGGAGAVSCTADYALFLDALANYGMAKNGQRILEPSSVELMRMNHLRAKQLEDFGKAGYGYGLGVRTHMDPGRSGSLSPIGEFGWDGAAGGFSMVDVKNKLSLTYFQQIHGWAPEIHQKLRNALYTDYKK